MKVLEGLRYTKEHEWIRLQEDGAYVGITDFAQDGLGDIVFVELPEADTRIEKGDVLGSLESVKTASDVYAPISGTILMVNDELEGSPELVNENPYDAWVAVIEPDDPKEVENLMDAEEYQKFCEEEA